MQQVVEKTMTKSVLLIEDEPNITEAVRYILSRDGWTVKTHAKGDNANDVISSYQPDLIILDVMLPGKNGYDILEQNFYFHKAEIDIVAQKNKETIVVVEVKTRNSNFFGNPQDFVSPSKIKLLVKAANEYIISKNLDVEVRFDIIAVIKNKREEKIEHFENAFYHF